MDIDLEFSPISMLTAIYKLYLYVSKKPHGFLGKWIITFTMKRNANSEIIEEIAKVKHKDENEVTGTIENRINTNDKYKFHGDITFNEINATYRPTKTGVRDSGVFNLTAEPDGNILKGNLIVDDTLNDRKIFVDDYVWRYLPPWYELLISNVYVGKSHINENGVFAKKIFKKNVKIGKLKLGNITEQGEYTIFFNGNHYEVNPPFKYLNHSCESNSKLIYGNPEIQLIATKEILPQMELTFDYYLLNEMILEEFKCKCPICSISNNPKTIKCDKIINTD